MKRTANTHRLPSRRHEHRAARRVKGSPCTGPMALVLQVADGRVVEAAFETDGCWSSITAGQAVSRLAAGRSLYELLDLTAADVLAAAGRLPHDGERCAAVVTAILHETARRALSRVADGPRALPASSALRSTSTARRPTS